MYVCIKYYTSIVGSFSVSVSKLVLSLDVFSRLRFIRPQVHVYEAGLFRVSEFGSHVLLRAKVSKKGGNM